MRPLLLLGIACFPAACADIPAPAEFREARQFLEQSIAQGLSPGVSIAVIRNGAVVWSEGLGYADLEAKRRATADSIYSMASVSKPFTGTALMTQVEKGAIDLDRPANDYLPGTKLRNYAGDAREITVRRLANHTAGFPTHFNFFHDGTQPPTWDETLRRYGFAFVKPGTRQEYSNLAFGILAYITELVSKTPRREYLERTVFDPLGMSRTSDRVRPGREADAAVQYMMEAGGRFLRTKPYAFDHPGASVYWSSANDLALFVRMHLNHDALGKVRILRPESALAMRTPVGTATPAEGFNEGSLANSRFGIGWAVEKFLGHECFYHSGGMPGVANMVRVFPENNSAVIVLTNTDDRTVARDAAIRVARVLVNEPTAVAAAAPATERTMPAGMAGVWSGKLEHFDGAVGMRLTILADGKVEVRFGNRPPQWMMEPVFGQTNLTGWVDALLRTREDYHGVAPLRFRLWRDGDKVSGFAMSNVTGYFGLPSYVELTR
ncbi:MAG: serine hydrolase [Candidatus Solibacter sp.]|nr:serine hydrolase [Candidatus Solibacter sp.]